MLTALGTAYGGWLSGPSWVAGRGSAGGRFPVLSRIGKRFPPGAGKRHTRRWLAVGIGAFVGLVTVLGAGQPAFAHAQLVGTSPANGARLDTAPTEIRLQFSEGVNLVRDGVRLLDSSGAVRGAGPAQIDPNSSARVLVPVPAGLGTGVYTVVWRVVSSDSHPIHGALVFGVGDIQVTAQPEVGARTDVDPAVNAIFWLFRWLSYAALALLLGGAVFLTICWTGGWVQRRARRVLAVGWGGSLLCAAAVLLLQGAYAVGGSLADIADPIRLRDTIDTGYGSYLLARIALLAGSGVLLFGYLGSSTRRPARWATVALTVLLAGLPVTWIGTGHANAAASPLIAAADAAHLFAMAAWIGGLVLLVACVLPASAAVATSEAAPAVRRFSRLAAVSVVILGTTGTYQAWHNVGTLSALAGTQYGRLLAFKLAAIGIVLWFAAASRSLVQRHYVGPAANAETRQSTAELVTAGRSEQIPVAARSDGRRGGSRVVPADNRRGGSRVGPIDNRRGNKRTRAERDQQLQARRELGRSVGIEVLLVLGVLGVTSMLVATPPGARPLAQSQDIAQTQTAAPEEAVADLAFDSGRVMIRVNPTRTGATTLTVAVRDEQGRPLDVPEVTARLSLAARGLGPLPAELTKRRPGEYESTGLTLPMAGTWQLEIKVRTSEIDQYSVSTAVSVR